VPKVVDGEAAATKSFAKSFEGDIEANLVPVPKTVDHRLGRIEDGDLDTLDRMAIARSRSSCGPRRTDRRSAVLHSGFVGQPSLTCIPVP